LGGVTWPAHQQSCDGRRRDFPGPRCSRTAERDSLGPGGTRFARLRGTTSDRVGHCRFLQSTGLCGRQNRQYSSRSALGGGTCALLFDPNNIRQTRFSGSVMSCCKARAAHVTVSGVLLHSSICAAGLSLPQPSPSRGRAPMKAHKSLPQKSHGQTSSRPVVSKSGKFRVAKRPPLMRAMAAIIPSGAVMGRPCRSAALMMSP
jgi:hypothetical protein